MLFSFVSQRCIINNTHRLVELCVAKLSQDWFPLLELLAMATNPHCKFHIYNGTRPSETVPAGAQLPDDELYARPPDPRSPKVNLKSNLNSPYSQPTRHLAHIKEELHSHGSSAVKEWLIWCRCRVVGAIQRHCLACLPLLAKGQSLLRVLLLNCPVIFVSSWSLSALNSQRFYKNPSIVYSVFREKPEISGFLFIRDDEF